MCGIGKMNVELRQMADVAPVAAAQGGSGDTRNASYRPLVCESPFWIR